MVSDDNLFSCRTYQFWGDTPKYTSVQGSANVTGPGFSKGDNRLLKIRPLPGLTQGMEKQEQVTLQLVPHII